MSDNVRQHHNLATGKGLTSAPTGKSPGYARGGQVTSKGGVSHASCPSGFKKMPRTR